MTGTKETQNNDNTRHAIVSYALSHGFDAIGFTRPVLSRQVRADMRAFVAQGNCGDMTWLQETLSQRLNPQQCLPDVKTLVMLGVAYTPQADPLRGLQEKSRGVISVYARGRDYHHLIKKRLKGLGRWVAHHYGGAWRICVDTAPVMEKPLAQQAGIGWQGKHTHLVSRAYGSWLFLACLMTTLDLGTSESIPRQRTQRDTRHAGHCGRCRACLDICPTDALPSPHRLDVHRCIAYLTIEHKGVIERSLRPMIGNRIFGCDDCLAVCPWNKFAYRSHQMSITDRWHGEHESLAFFATLSEDSFRQYFRGTAIVRTGRARFMRNVLIAIGNSGDRTLVSSVALMLDDAVPLVRAMAVWALARLADRDMVAMYHGRYGAGETHPMVRAEWRAEGFT
ncbi:MAG: tRNA epoxyqueuosine(34) reductase QueG [Alphaproteobacteria bacterium GM7ARS4]|nr:tRNA epoxyqueuosine(34) reductase QueG [Alphaproteobacteria bacterium GM7ARS4]